MDRADIKIYVDGFPKSGNTFLKNAIEESTGLKIDNPSHTILKIDYLVKNNHIVFITLRDPLDSIASFIALKNDLSPENIKKYTDYYERIYSYVLSIKENIELAPFSQIVTDVSEFINKLSNSIKIYKNIENIEIIEKMKKDENLSKYIPGEREYSYYEARNLVISSDQSLFQECYNLYYSLISYYSLAK